VAAGQTKNNKSNQKKSTSTRGRKPGRGNVHKRTEENPNREIYRDEIILIITLVVSLLLILSNFNLSGKVGGAINTITFGLFGLIAYLLPFFIFFAVAFYMANRGSRVALHKLVSGGLLGIALSAFIQMITLGFQNDTTVPELFLNSAKQKNGGGIIGGLLCKLLHPLFGTVGTYIILLALMVICIMFLTGKALFRYLGTKSEASIQQMRERRLQREEEYDEEEDYSDIDSEDTSKKRKARTVELKKNNESKKDSANSKENTEEGGFFQSRKKKKGKDVSDLPTDSTAADYFDMQEITSGHLPNIPIQRDGVSEGEQKVKSYEEVLKQKFGNKPEESDKTEPTEIREGIDDDIKRLLKAAGQDAEAQAFESFSGKNDSQEGFEVQENQALQEDTFIPTVDVDYLFEAPDGRMSETVAEDNMEADEVVSAFETEEKTTAPTGNLDEKDSSSAKAESNESVVPNIDTAMKEANAPKEYSFPPVDLLGKPKGDAKSMSDRDLKETAMKLQKTLESFGVRVTITNVSCGPAVTRYELQPEQGVKVSKITGLADDIKLNLAAADVRIEAPIPGKAAVGIEVPNKENSAVMFRELIESKEFSKHPSDIAFAVGKDIGGQTVVTDIGKMPHLLIAGATGSGKSVCINTLIMSILYKAKPSDVRMIMVDPKVVELSVYNGIPHLLIPVVTDPKKASAALNWAVMEMTERYKKFADLGVRDVKSYNEKIATVEEYKDERYQKLPQIVIIVDELADLMMVAPGEVEDAICRLAQMARAAGLHLIIATQRPSVNVITGLIKANIPSRIAFSVSSAIDSRTIIDGSGAEKLLGKGDMLFFPSGYPKPVRVQGAFISDKEVGAVVDFLTAQNNGAEYNEDVANKISSVQASDSGSSNGGANERDDYFIEAGKFIIEKDKASIGMLQRVYKIGFNRAARIMDQLAEAGVVGPEEGTKPRKILMSMEEFEQYVDEYV
jgi:S-DNA-T family DNA segregation ATPase FtsK/SpoIIIE